MHSFISRYAGLFLLIFTTLGFTSNGQSLRKGPYLIYPGNPGEMKILWQTHATVSSEIRWGTTPSVSDGVASPQESGNGNNQHQYSYSLTGLETQTRYYYTLIAGSDTVAASFFSASDPASKKVKFLVYGDTRSHPEDVNAVSGAMLTAIDDDADLQTFLLHTGDFNSNDKETRWDGEYFNRNYASNLQIQSSMPVVGVRGNHEQLALNYNKYWPYPYEHEGDYYSLDYGPLHLAIIDEYVDFSTGSEQLQWLKNDLAGSSKPWKFIALHEPGYTDESYHQNNLEVQQYIQPICQEYNVQLVLTGHNHYYAHCLIDSVHHLTLGGGGAPLYDVFQVGEGLLLSEKTFHFAEININHDSVSIRVKRLDGSVVDSFVLVDQIQNVPEVNLPKIIFSQIEKNLLIKDNKRNRLLKIYDIQGRTMLTRNIPPGNQILSLAHFKKGVYFIRLGNSAQASQKIMIR